MRIGNKVGAARSGAGGGALLAALALSAASVLPVASPAAGASSAAGAPRADRLPLGAVPAKPPKMYAYVTSDAGTTPIDTSTNTVGNTLFSVGDAFAFTAGGTELVTLGIGRIDIVATATNRVIAKIPDPNLPDSVVVAPDGATAYAFNPATDKVTAADLAAHKVVATITVGARPVAAAFTPNGRLLFVVDQASSDISVIDTATDKVVKTIHDGTANAPRALVVSRDGKTVYVLNQPGSNMDGSVAPIAVATLQLGAAIAVGKAPVDAAITPDGQLLLVTDGAGNAVTAISTAKHKVVATIAVGAPPANVDPTSIVVAPDGRTAYVAMSSVGGDEVWPISLPTLTARKPIKVGTDPTALAITPDSRKLYVADYLSESISAVDTRTGAAGAPIPVGSNLQGIATMPVPFMVGPGYLPRAAVGTRYSTRLAVAGGEAGLRWKVAGGKLPAGLVLTGAGKITGTPRTAEKVRFEIAATDASGQSVTEVFALRVA